MPQKSPDERLLLLITSRCSGKCPECLYRENLGRQADLSLNALEEKILPFIGSRHEIHIAGGEPTEHPQFFKIIELIAGKNPAFIQIISNGLPFSGSKRDASAFALRLQSIADKSPTRIFARFSIDDIHAEGIKGGKGELARRAKIINEVFSKTRGKLGFGFYSLKDKGQKESEILRAYGLPRKRTMFSLGERGFKLGGNEPTTFISAEGNVYRHEREFLRRQAPMGNITSLPLQEILKRRYTHR
ncbi:MAG: radical SAM protein [Candidatus Diapherotrites archaeon]